MLLVCVEEEFADYMTCGLLPRILSHRVVDLILPLIISLNDENGFELN